VLGEFTREHQTDSGLDLAAGESRLLVVSGELSGLGGDTFEDIVDEGVHDGHSLLRDTGIGVDLLEHLVDVRGIRLDALLVLLATGCLLGGCLSGLLGGCLGHDECLGCKVGMNRVCVKRVASPREGPRKRHECLCTRKRSFLPVNQS
jgi:hypothetical protein